MVWNAYEDWSWYNGIVGMYSGLEGSDRGCLGRKTEVYTGPSMGGLGMGKERVAMVGVGEQQVGRLSVNGHESDHGPGRSHVHVPGG
jgi:hypothetical protein